MEAQCKYSNDKNMYKCYVTEISVNNSNKWIEAFRGKHEADKTDSDVKWLVIENQNLKFFPINLDKHFPNLSHLEIYNCGLEKIPRNGLHGLGKLEFLSLTHNKMTTLSDHLFTSMDHLKKIFFRDNQLVSFSIKLLKPIQKTLQHADFRRNKNIDDYFSLAEPGKDNLQKFMQVIDDNCKPPIQIDIDEKNHRIEMIEKTLENIKLFKMSGEFADFKIKVSGREFEVHKVILAAQSSVFKEMFTSDDTDAMKPFTKVQNFSENAFESFLDFFYTGRLKADDNAMEIIGFASEFNVLGLKTLCIQKIIDNLSEEDALEVYNLGHRFSSYELRKVAFELLQTIYPDMPDSLLENAEKIGTFVEAKRAISIVTKEAPSDSEIESSSTPMEEKAGQ